MTVRSKAHVLELVQVSRGSFGRGTGNHPAAISNGGPCRFQHRTAKNRQDPRVRTFCTYFKAARPGRSRRRHGAYACAPATAAAEFEAGQRCGQDLGPDRWRAGSLGGSLDGLARHGRRLGCRWLLRAGQACERGYRFEQQGVDAGFTPHCFWACGWACIRARGRAPGRARRRARVWVRNRSRGGACRRASGPASGQARRRQSTCAWYANKRRTASARARGRTPGQARGPGGVRQHLCGRARAHDHGNGDANLRAHGRANVRAHDHADAIWPRDHADAIWPHDHAKLRAHGRANVRAHG